MNYADIIPSLFLKYINNQCVPEEVDLLLQTFAQTEHRQWTSPLIENQVNQPLHEFFPFDDALRFRLEQRLKSIVNTIPAT